MNIDSEEYHFLCEHRVSDFVIFPAAGMIYLMTLAMQEMTKTTCFTLRSVEIVSPLLLDAGVTYKAHVMLENAASETHNHEHQLVLVTTSDDYRSRSVHARAYCAATTANFVDKDNVQSSTRRPCNRLLAVL